MVKTASSAHQNVVFDIRVPDFLRTYNSLFRHRVFLPYLQINRRSRTHHPTISFHSRASSENFSCRYAFYHRHYLRHAVSRDRLHQKLHVIFISSNFYKLDLTSFRYPQANFLQNHINVFVEHYPSVLRREHYELLQQCGDVVPF